MGFVLRGSRNFTSGTLISPDGRARSIEDGGFLAVPLKTGGPEDRPVPTQWRITVPEHGIEATVTAINPDSWMRHSFSYWEGPVQIAGERSGTGYLEMTGY
jgi:predicted secreted hydrolase